MQMRFFLTLVFLLVGFHLFSQDHKADSLKQILSATTIDTVKVNVLNEISFHYRGNAPLEAMRYAIQAKELAEKSNFKKGLAKAYKNIGLAFYFQSKYVETLENFEKSRSIYDSIGDKQGITILLNNIGSVYYTRGSEAKALEYFLRSLKIAEELKDKNRIAPCLGSIANVYGEKRATYDKALDFYKKALVIAEEIADSNTIGSTTVGIGEIYLKKVQFDTALQRMGYLDSAIVYFKKSLDAYAGTEAVAYSLNDLGQAYVLKNDYLQAVDYHNRALALATQLDNKLYVSQSLLGLGKAYEKQDNYKAALASFKKAEQISMEIVANYELKGAYEGLANAYYKTSDYLNAFKYQTLLTIIKDTIYNIESDKKLGSLQFDFDIQKKEGEINLLTKDKEIQQQVIERQRIIRNSFMGAFITMVVFATVFFRQRNRISKEKKRSDELLLNILPEETAEELKATGTAKTKSFDLVSVLFTDFKNFTQASEKLTPEELVQEINHCYSEFDKIITKHGIEKIKTIGDAYMCAGGLPVSNSTHPVDVVKAGLEMVDFIERNKQERIAKDQPFFELRLGIHTGPVVAGIVGIKKFAYDIWGDTVNTASRMESSGEIGRVNISGATYELIKDKFICVHRGKVKAKNKGEIDMYFVDGPVA